MGEFPNKFHTSQFDRYTSIQTWTQYALAVVMMLATLPVRVSVVVYFCITDTVRVTALPTIGIFVNSLRLGHNKRLHHGSGRYAEMV